MFFIFLVSFKVLSRTLNNGKKRIKIHKDFRKNYCSAVITETEYADAKPYSEVPGPRPAPIFGNTWR